MHTHLSKAPFSRFWQSRMFTCLLVIQFLFCTAGARVGIAQDCDAWAIVSQGGLTPRDSHCMVYDSLRGVCVVFGGFYRANYLMDTWEWNGAAWTQVAIDGPPPRREFAMAYDSSRGVTVLFGGQAEFETLGDTWEWDGQTWRLVATGGPQPSVGAAMAFDEARGVMVLFGDFRTTNTWTWDGVQWRLVDTDGPSVRIRHAMAYDSARQKVVLFGGQDLAIRDLGDTWEWDGQSWTQVAQDGPAARNVAEMVFDEAIGASVMFGGSSRSNSHLGDVWEWDGAQWTQILSDRPSPRWGHAMAYDSGRRATVLFGGDGTGVTDETWERIVRVRILEHPTPVTVDRGQSAEFSIGATGVGELQYQWRRDESPLEDDGRIAGSHTPYLSVLNTACDDAGAYDCVVTGDCIPQVSNSARLVVRGDVQLSVVGTCPGGGPAVISWRCATPREELALVFSTAPGQFRIPRNLPCHGTLLSLLPSRATLLWKGSTGLTGSATLRASFGAGACGGYLQAVDLESCEPSNLIRIN